MGAPSVRSPVARTSGAALAAIAVLMLLGGCGSGQVKEKIALAADTTTTETKTVTEPARTVTAPTRTETVTKTETTPGKTTTIESHTTTVAVKPTSTSGGGSSGGIPGWAWVLIGAGAVLLAVTIFMLGRSHGERRRDTGPARPGPASGWDQPGVPPRGPPEDPI